MEHDERLRKAIQDIARRRSNVTLSDIDWVMGNLGPTLTVRRRAARHGVLFGVGSRRFMVNQHNPGSKQVKKYSVDDFLEVMEELGLYEEEEEAKDNE